MSETNDSVNSEKLSDVLLGQDVEFEVAGRKIVLQPRTLAQLLVISKQIVQYNDNLFLGIQKLQASDAETDDLGEFLKLPYEHIAYILSMFLDSEKVYKKTKPTVSVKFILNEINFTTIREIATAALNMHDVTDIIKNLNGLRITS